MEGRDGVCFVSDTNYSIFCCLANLSCPCRTKRSLATTVNSARCCDGRDVDWVADPGTFQQYTLAPANYVTPIPDALSSEDAAPLLCAGVTV
jgi:D-arabinose 1-dehydrogenase-like Zn-dependent alcohol dehydrogenase